MPRSSRRLREQRADSIDLQVGSAFHRRVCLADATGEALSGLLRPAMPARTPLLTMRRSSTRRTVSCRQMSKLATVRRGRLPLSNARSSAGPTRAAPPRLNAAAGQQHCRFFTSATTNDHVQATIFDAEGIEEVWVRARKHGVQRDGSSVCELTSSSVSRCSQSGQGPSSGQERAASPGAQRSLFPSSSTATGALTPTVRATPMSSTSRCAPTRTSRTTTPG